MKNRGFIINFVTMIFSNISQNIFNALVFMDQVFRENSQANNVSNSKFSDVKNIFFLFYGVILAVQNAILHCILDITIRFQTFSWHLKIFQKAKVDNKRNLEHYESEKNIKSYAAKYKSL